MKTATAIITLRFPGIEILEAQTAKEAVLNWLEEVDRVVFKDEIGYGRYELKVEEEDDGEPEPDCPCPGCGCLPGNGITADCNHPDGCGYFKHEAGQADAEAT